MLAPGDVRGVEFVEEVDLLSVDDDAIIEVADLSWETTMSSIILQQVRGVLRRKRGVVDSSNAPLPGGDESPEHKLADAAESVDTEANRHLQDLVI